MRTLGTALHSFKDRNSCVRFGHIQSRRAPVDTKLFPIPPPRPRQDPPVLAAVKKLYPDPDNSSSSGVVSAKWAESPCFYKAAHADVSPPGEPGLLFISVRNVLQGHEINGDSLLQFFEIKKNHPNSRLFNRPSKMKPAVKSDSRSVGNIVPNGFV